MPACRWRSVVVLLMVDRVPSDTDLRSLGRADRRMVLAYIDAKIAGQPIDLRRWIDYRARLRAAWGRKKR